MKSGYLAGIQKCFIVYANMLENWIVALESANVELSAKLLNKPDMHCAWF
jgi:hypothetical protein